MLFRTNVIFSYKTGPIQLISPQQCGYWWPGAVAPGHQYPQCWVFSHAFPATHAFPWAKVGNKVWGFLNLGWSFKIALGWMPQNTFDEKSSLVQTMALSHQAQAIVAAYVDPDPIKIRAPVTKIRMSVVRPSYFLKREFLCLERQSLL